MKLLILDAHGVHHVGKTINADGSTKQSSYPTYWSPHEQTVESLNDFSQIAFQIERDCSKVSIALGELNVYGRSLMERGQVIHKRHNRDGDVEPTIQDQAQNLILLDIEYEDDLEHLSPRERIERHILRLPSCFHGASYHAQLSSSFGIKQGLRVHVFFWTDRPITSKLLRAYLSKLKDQDGRALVDHQPIHPSNAIVMTRPVMSCGLKDHLVDRSILVTKAQSSVSLPSSAYKVKPIKTYTPQVPYSTGIVDEDQWAREALEMTCMRASGLHDGRNEQLFKDAIRLGSLIGGDRLHESEVKLRLMNAYEVNGLVGKRKRRDVERTIDRGIEKGKLNPNRLDRYVSHRSTSRAIQPRATKQLKPIQSPSQPQEIKDKTSQLIAESIRKAQPRVISVAQSDTGAGKTVELTKLAKSLHDQGESVIYLALNHSLIEEENGLLDRFQKLGAHSHHWEGKTRRCEEVKRVKAQLSETPDDQETRALLVEYEDLLVEQSIPQFCLEISCPMHNTDQCSAWREEERLLEGQLVVAPHSYLNYLVEREERGELPENQVIIIDESHQVIHSTPYEMDLIKGLSYRDQDTKFLNDDQSGVELNRESASYHSAIFRAKHQPVSKFASQLHQLLVKLSASVTVNQYGVIERLSASTLLSLDPDIKEIASTALTYIEREKPKVAKLKRRELKKFKSQEVIIGERVKRSGLRILTDLAQLITGSLDNLHTLHLKVDSSGAYVERRVIQPLPETSRILLADATPKLMMLKDYAEILNFEVEVTESEINPQVVEGLHIETKQLRQSALFEAGQDQLKPSAIKSLNHLSHPIRNMLRKLSDGDQVGVLCSRKLWIQLEEARHGRGELLDGELVNTLKRFDVITGYFGRDHQGSNAFEKCKALIMLGEYKPNVGSSKADFESLSGRLDKSDDYDPEKHFNDLYREQIDAITTQAFGRLRSVRRPDLIFIYASERVSQLKGVNWSLYKVESRPINQETQEVELQAHRLLDEGLKLTTNLIKEMGVKKNSITRLIQRIAQMRPLKEEKESKGRGRPSSVWFDPTIKPNQEGVKPAESESSAVVKKPNENRQIVFNPVSHKWSLGKLLERSCNDIKKVIHQVPYSYIYIIGETGLNPMSLKYKGFLPLEMGSESEAPDEGNHQPLFSFPEEVYG